MSPPQDDFPRRLSTPAIFPARVRRFVAATTPVETMTKSTDHVIHAQFSPVLAGSWLCVAASWLGPCMRRVLLRNSSHT